MIDEKKELPFKFMPYAEDGLFDQSYFLVPESQARALWEGARIILELIADGDLMPSSKCYNSGNCDKVLTLLKKGIGE